MPPHRTALPALLITVALALGACAGKDPEIVNGPAYPSVKQSSVLDIQVIRDGKTITMTNTSTQVFTDARLWAIQWYSHPLPSWKPGETLSFDLSNFKDRYGNPMRAGGFWAVDNPEKLVLMQVEQGDKLIGLVVVGAPE